MTDAALRRNIRKVFPRYEQLQLVVSIIHFQRVVNRMDRTFKVGIIRRQAGLQLLRIKILDKRPFRQQ